MAASRSSSRGTGGQTGLVIDLPQGGRGMFELVLGPGNFQKPEGWCHTWHGHLFRTGSFVHAPSGLGKTGWGEIL